jgi:UPF0755 protein
MQFLALRAAKLRFLTVEITKLKFCNFLSGDKIMVKAIRLFFKFLSVMIVLALAVLSLVLGLALYLNSPPKRIPVPLEESMRLEKDGELFIEVRDGESAFSVGRRLETAGVIRNRYFWSFLFRLDGDQVKTGSYKIELPASQIKIRSVLTGGDQILVKVTIPEGVTLKKTAGILEEAGICAAESFLAASSAKEILDAYNVPNPTMEGYLYPDTYLFPLGYPASKVAETMADTFFSRLDGICPEAVSMSASELNTRVVLASIVEREYRVPEEAALMAGVFFNRLKIGMALQSCATVVYVITEVRGMPHPSQLLNRDLEIRDPYNTYLRPGLPPGPISAPGGTALKAAFYPGSSDYLYFRLTDLSTGRHYFSRTLDDHIRAGNLYVKER